MDSTTGFKEYARRYHYSLLFTIVWVELKSKSDPPSMLTFMFAASIFCETIASGYGKTIIELLGLITQSTAPNPISSHQTQSETPYELAPSPQIPRQVQSESSREAQEPQQEFQQLQQKIQQLQQKIQQLQEDSAKPQTVVQQFQQKCKKLEEENQQLQEDPEKSQPVVQQLQKKCKKLQEDNLRFQSFLEVEKKNSRMIAIRAEKITEAAENKAEAAKKESERLVRENESRYNNAFRKVTEAQADKFAKWTKQENAYQSEIADLKKQVKTNSDADRSEISPLTGKEHELSTDALIKRHERAIVSLTEEHRKENNDQEAKIFQLTEEHLKETADQEAKIFQLTEEHRKETADQEAKITQLTREKANQEVKIAQLSREKADQETKNTCMLEKLAESERQRDEHKHKSDEAEKQAQRDQKAHEDVKVKLADLQRQSKPGKESKKAKADQKIENSRLKKSVAIATYRFSQAEKKLQAEIKALEKDSAEEIEAFKGQISQLQGEIVEQQSQLVKFQSVHPQMATVNSQPNGEDADLQERARRAEETSSAGTPAAKQQVHAPHRGVGELKRENGRLVTKGRKEAKFKATAAKKPREPRYETICNALIQTLAEKKELQKGFDIASHMSARFKGENDHLRSQLEDLKAPELYKELKLGRDKIEDLKAQIKNRNGRIKELNDKLEMEKSTNRILENQKMQELDQKNMGLVEEIDKLKEDLEMYEVGAKCLRGDIDKSNEYIKELESRLETDEAAGNQLAAELGQAVVQSSPQGSDELEKAQKMNKDLLYLAMKFEECTKEIAVLYEELVEAVQEGNPAAISQLLQDQKCSDMVSDIKTIWQSMVKANHPLKPW